MSRNWWDDDKPVQLASAPAGQGQNWWDDDEALAQHHMPPDASRASQPIAEAPAPNDRGMFRSMVRADAPDPVPQRSATPDGYRSVMTPGGQGFQQMAPSRAPEQTDDWYAKQQRIAEQDAENKRGSASLNMGSEYGYLKEGPDGTMQPSSYTDDVEKDLGKMHASAPIWGANAAIGVAESAANLPSDTYNTFNNASAQPVSDMQAMRNVNRMPQLQARVGEAPRALPKQAPTFDLPRVPMPKELESVSGQIAEPLTQFLLARGALGKIPGIKGGGMLAHNAKDAAALGIGMASQPRLSEIPEVQAYIQASGAPQVAKDFVAWLGESDPSNPLLNRGKLALEEFVVGSVLLVPGAAIAGKRAVAPALTPTNAGGARLGGRAPAAPQIGPGGAPQPVTAVPTTRPRPGAALPPIEGQVIPPNGATMPPPGPPPLGARPGRPGQPPPGPPPAAEPFRLPGLSPDPNAAPSAGLFGARPTADDRALDMVIKRLDRDGISVDDIQTAANSLSKMRGADGSAGGGSIETLAEIVQYAAAQKGKSASATMGLLDALATIPGETQSALVATINANRQALPARLRKSAVRLTGQNGQDATDTLIDVKRQMQEAATPAYDEFYDSPLEPRIFANEILPVLNTPNGQKAMQAARANLAAKAADLQTEASRGVRATAQAEWQRAQAAVKSIDDFMADPVRGTALPSPMALDYTKRAFDDVITEAGFGSDTARVVGSTKRNFADSVSNATGGKYGNALGIWEDGNRFDESFDLGLGFLNKSTREVKMDMAKGLNGRAWSGSDRDALALGIAAKIEDMVERNDSTALTALSREKVLSIAEAVLGDKKEAQAFANGIQRLIRNRQFGNKAIAGSDTARRLEAVKNATGQESDDVANRIFDDIGNTDGIPTPLNVAAKLSNTIFWRPAAKYGKEVYNRLVRPGIYEPDINAALAERMGVPLRGAKQKEVFEALRARQAAKSGGKGPPTSGAAQAATKTPKGPPPPSPKGKKGPPKAPPEQNGGGSQLNSPAEIGGGLVGAGVGYSVAPEDQKIEGAVLGGLTGGLATNLARRSGFKTGARDRYWAEQEARTLERQSRPEIVNAARHLADPEAPRVGEHPGVTEKRMRDEVGQKVDAWREWAKANGVPEDTWKAPRPIDFSPTFVKDPAGKKLAQDATDAFKAYTQWSDDVRAATARLRGEAKGAPKNSPPEANGFFSSRPKPDERSGQEYTLYRGVSENDSYADDRIGTFYSDDKVTAQKYVDAEKPGYSGFTNDGSPRVLKTDKIRIGNPLKATSKADALRKMGLTNKDMLAERARINKSLDEALASLARERGHDAIILSNQYGSREVIVINKARPKAPPEANGLFSRPKAEAGTRVSGYHGSNAEFDQPRVDMPSVNYGSTYTGKLGGGFYMVPEGARDAQRQASEFGKNVTRHEAVLQKPLIVEYTSVGDGMAQPNAGEQLLNKLRNEFRDPQALRAELRRRGYDGIIVRKNGKDVEVNVLDESRFSRPEPQAPLTGGTPEAMARAREPVGARAPVDVSDWVVRPYGQGEWVIRTKSGEPVGATSEDDIFRGKTREEAIAAAQKHADAEMQQWWGRKSPNERLEADLAAMRATHEANARRISQAVKEIRARDPRLTDEAIVEELAQRGITIERDQVWTYERMPPPKPLKASPPSSGGGEKMVGGTPEAMARAREQGFDVDTPLYHGTARDFESFDVDAKKATGGGFNDRGVFLTDSPKVASDYTELHGEISDIRGRHVMPVYARGKFLEVPLGLYNRMQQAAGDMRRGATIDEIRAIGLEMDLEKIGVKWDGKSDLIETIQAAGFDGMKVPRKIGRNYQPAGEVMVFDPKNIRGKFAAFDPTKKDSSKLLDSVAPKGGPTILPELGGAATSGTLAYNAQPEGTTDGERAASVALSMGLGAAGGRVAANRLVPAVKAVAANRAARRGPDQAGFAARKLEPVDEPVGQIETQTTKPTAFKGGGGGGSRGGYDGDIKAPDWLRYPAGAGAGSIAGGPIGGIAGSQMDLDGDGVAGTDEDRKLGLTLGVAAGAGAGAGIAGLIKYNAVLHAAKPSGAHVEKAAEAIIARHGVRDGIEAQNTVINLLKQQDVSIDRLQMAYRIRDAIQRRVKETEAMLSGEVIPDKVVRLGSSKTAQPQPPEANGFLPRRGGEPKGPPRPRMAKRVIAEIDRARETLPPRVEQAIARNAALPENERVSAMEAAGDDPAMFEMAAPFQRKYPAGKANSIPKELRPMEAGIQEAMERAGQLRPGTSAELLADLTQKDIQAAKELKNARAAQTRAETRGERSEAVFERRKAADANAQKAKQALAEAKLNVYSQEEMMDLARKRIEAIQAALNRQDRPGPKPAVGQLVDKPATRKAGPPKGYEARDMAAILFDKENAKVLDDVLSGRVIPKAHSPEHRVLSMATAGMAGVGAVGIGLMLRDIDQRAEALKIEKAGGKPQGPWSEPAFPDYQFIWEKAKANPRFVEDMQRKLRDSNPEYKLTPDKKWGAHTEQTFKHWQWTNGFEPDGIPTEEQLKRLDETALAGIRKQPLPVN